MLPILRWIEFIIKNAHKINIPVLRELEIANYYNHVDKHLTINEWAEETKAFFLEEKVASLFKDYVDCLKKLQ
jgi:hypothetical protein